MELNEEMIHQLKTYLSNALTYQDLMVTDGVIKKLLKNAIERISMLALQNSRYMKDNH